MMMDNVADLLTRIRNANMVQMSSCDIPASKLKIAILEILKTEGYIKGYKKIEDNKQNVLKVDLKFTAKGERVIHQLQRVSRPSRRVYLKAENLETACNGLGLTIVSTSQGVMTGQEAKRRHIGGEVLCEVW